MPDNKTPTAPTQELAETGRAFYQRGWALGTSGNFSMLLARKPFRLFITAGGNEMGALDETNFLELDDDAEILQGFGRPSDETLLHLTIYRLRPRARCILHSHSVWGTLLADRMFVDGAIALHGYELLKGLPGVTSYTHTERIPIVENSDDNVAQAHVISNVLLEAADSHAIFVRRHGLFTWGETVADARRNVEIYEFLFEVLGRTETINNGK